LKYGLMSVLFPPRCAGCGTLLDFRGPGKEFTAFCSQCKDIWESELLDTCGGCGLAVSLCRCRTEEIVRAHGEGLWKRVYYLQGKKHPPQNRILYKIKRQASAIAIEFLSAELELALENLIAEEQPDLSLTRIAYFPRSRRSALRSGTSRKRTGIRPLTAHLHSA